MPLSRNLKVWVTPYVSLQQLCHLNPLKTTQKHIPLKFWKIKVNKMFKILLHINTLVFCKHTQFLFTYWIIQRQLSATYMSDMSLKIFQSKGAHDKPEFKRTETSAEGNLPVLNNRKKVLLLDEMIHSDGWFVRTYHKVSGCLWVFMPEINRINIEGLLELIFIFYPAKT